MISWIIDRCYIKQPRLRRAVTKLVFGDRDVQIELFGVPFQINTLRENGYLRAARKTRNSSLLRDEIAPMITIANLLRPGDTFVDVGANIGLYSCTLARRTAHNKANPLRFYAYEPHPDTFKRLVHNAKECGVIARNLAVSDNKATLEFVDGAVSHVFTRIEQRNAYNINSSRIVVPAVRLDEELIEGESIVLKIDVEGQEFSAVKGASKLFAACKIKAVYFDGYKDKSLVEGFLRDYGFSIIDLKTMGSITEHTFGLLAIHPSRFTKPESHEA